MTFSEMTCGLFGALSLKTKEAVFVPRWGTHLKLVLQLAPGASDVPQVVDSVKPWPLITTLERLRVSLPVFVRTVVPLR
jgi:hypothetical protein